MLEICFFCHPRAAASILLAFSQSSHIGAIAVVWISGCCSTLSASFRSCRRRPNIRQCRTEVKCPPLAASPLSLPIESHSHRIHCFGPPTLRCSTHPALTRPLRFAHSAASRLTSASLALFSSAMGADVTTPLYRSHAGARPPPSLGPQVHGTSRAYNR
jgi:hypothetical protein